MRLVEQHVIARTDQRYRPIDAAAFASKNLWNAANYVFFYGDHVAHLHLHIFARYPGTPEEYWRERVGEWSGSPKGGAEEIADLCDRLRRSLANQAA